MVFFFTSRAPLKWTIFAGENKEENDLLIKYGFPEDIWFHIHDLPSAHVYIRMPDGKGIDDIPPTVFEDCLQLVKNNSIQGQKRASVTVVYTLWSNLHKTPSMDVGQVGFHDEKLTRKVSVTKNPSVLKEVEKTKVQRDVDLAQEKEMRLQRDRLIEKNNKIQHKKKLIEQSLENKRIKDILNYKDIMIEENMNSNKENFDIKSVEDDFM